MLEGSSSAAGEKLWASVPPPGPRAVLRVVAQLAERHRDGLCFLSRKPGRLLGINIGPAFISWLSLVLVYSLLMWFSFFHQEFANCWLRSSSSVNLYLRLLCF